MFAFRNASSSFSSGLYTLFIWFAGPYFAFADFGRSTRVCAADCDRHRGWDLAGVPADEADEAPRERSAADGRRLTPHRRRKGANPGRSRQTARTVRGSRRGAGSSAARGTACTTADCVIISAPDRQDHGAAQFGLRFPLEQRVGKARFAAAEHGCDVHRRSASTAVTTQDSDAASDGVGWASSWRCCADHRARRR